MTCRDTGASILPCPRVPCPLRMSSVPLRYPYSHVPSPQVVPIPVTTSSVFMACPHPHAPCPSRVSSSPWGVPISMAPFPPGCFLFPFCVPRPLLPQHVCHPMLSLTPQDVPIPPGCSLGYPLIPRVSLSPRPLSPWGDPLSLWSVPIFPKVFPSSILLTLTPGMSLCPQGVPCHPWDVLYPPSP